MKVWRAFRDWCKYERLGHYPMLAQFGREEGLRRLLSYEREERETTKAYWQIVYVLAAVVFAIAWLIDSYFGVGAVVIAWLINVPLWGFQIAMHHRLRRRVEAKVAAELGDGRLWTCIGCGYDLRASEDRCPECGEAIRVTAPDTHEVAPGAPRRFWWAHTRSVQ